MATDSKRFETLVLHGGSYRADPVERRGRGADPSDDVLPVPGHRPRLAPLRARRARQHLHPRAEPDLGRARAARRRARRRRRGARRRLRSDGLGLFGAEPRPGRRQHRLLDRPLRRHLDAVRADAEAVRHRDALRRSDRPREFPPRDRRQDERLLRRDPAQPEAQRLSDQGGRRHRPLARRAADRRQHRDAADRAAVRAWRGGRRLFRDQVHRRPRQLDRRPDRRRRQFPVGAARRPLPAADRSRTTPITARSGPRPRSRSGRSPMSLRARVKLLRDIGAALSPFNAFLLLQGLETLPLRLRQHNENAIAVANFLKDRRDVSHVIFPGLQTGEARRRADAYLKGGYGGARRLRAEGRRRGGDAVHRRAEALLPRRQHRRRALARHPSRLDHASAARRRRAARRPA